MRTIEKSNLQDLNFEYLLLNTTERTVFHPILKRRKDILWPKPKRSKLLELFGA